MGGSVSGGRQQGCSCLTVGEWWSKGNTKSVCALDARSSLPRLRVGEIIAKR